MRKTVLFVLLFFLSDITLFAQESQCPSFETIGDSLVKQLAIFPQEKIHLHTDRDRYIPGEKIWFKAYVVDALTHRSSTPSKYVYVELINASDSLIDRVMIRRDEKGMFYGHLYLADLIPEGYYTLRGYTRFMENLGDDYFFKKDIWIGNLRHETNEETKRKRKGRHPQGDYAISFFPEGGQLLNGVFCRVAFKALHQNGYPEEIVGELVDEAGVVITEAKTVHAGMGAFVFMPEAGKKYSFKSKNKDGLEKQFELPLARSTVSISVAHRNNDHLVTLNTSPDYTEKPLYLLIHSGGILHYFEPWNTNKKFISFPDDFFPSGVLQFLLFDEAMNPLSERLSFNRTEDQAQAVFRTDRTEYGRREKVTAEIYLTDMNAKADMSANMDMGANVEMSIHADMADIVDVDPVSNPAASWLAGHLSISITDDKDVEVDSLTTIYTSLLLSSELKGHIGSPGYYLQDNVASKNALDLLMMTHGWRRYNLPEAFSGHYELPEIPYEETKEISGTLTRLLSDKPVIAGEVSMFTHDGTFGKTYSDSTGRFGFYGLDGFPDSTAFFVQAKTGIGKNRVELTLNTDTFPKLRSIAHRADLSNEYAEKKEAEEFLKKAEQRTKYDEDLRLINLPEVEVTARTPKKRSPNIFASPFFDYTMYREEIDRTRASTVYLLLMRMPGLMVLGEEVRMLGVHGRPLIMIDGFPHVWENNDSPLDWVSVDDLECIDLIKPPRSSMFRGGQFGIICLNTRRGEVPNKPKLRYNYASYMPLGFQQPEEFYGPVYDTLETKNLSNPDYRTTIFWKPDLMITGDEGEEKVTFEFYTSDFYSTYSIVIEGLSVDGKMIRQVEKITVK